VSHAVKANALPNAQEPPVLTPLVGIWYGRCLEGEGCWVRLSGGKIDEPTHNGAYGNALLVNYGQVASTAP
jgi:hypothetical protein